MRFSRITWIVIVVEVVLAAVGLLVGRWVGIPIRGGIRVDLLSTGLAVAATVPLFGLFYWNMRTEIPVFSEIRKILHEALLPLFAGSSWLEIFIVSLMAGVGEEIFFRGFLQQWLGGIVHPWVAVALVGALFGLVHAVSVGYALVTALIGVYLGGLFLATGNLFVAIAVHALFDFAALLWLLRMTPAPAAEPGVT